MTQDVEQLGFDALLSKAEIENRKRVFERETAHLPDNMTDAIPYFRHLIDTNHAAVLEADTDGSRHCHKEARLLAGKLNGRKMGTLAGDDAPCCILARKTKAKDGDYPLWGQCGRFIIKAANMMVRIDMEGLFGIGSGFGFWPGFSARTVDSSRSFLSDTGYQSFLGVHADIEPGLTPDSFATMIVERYVEHELHSQLRTISKR